MENRRISPWRMVSFALAALLLLAARLKLHQALTVPTLGSGWLASRWFQTTVIETELLLGLWLMSGLFPRWAWRACLALFALFSLAALGRAVSGASSCGCFGQVQVNPWITSLMDVGVIVLLLTCRPPPQDISFTSPRLVLRALAVLSLWLVVASFSAAAIVSHRPATLDVAGQVLGDGRTVVLEPESWVGKRFPLLDWIDIDADLTQGEWTIVLYRTGCGACHRVLTDYDALARSVSSVGFRVRFACVGDALDHSFDPPAGEGILVGRRIDHRSWSFATPTVVLLESGVVMSVYEPLSHVGDS